MSEMDIEEELKLIRQNRAPAGATPPAEAPIAPPAPPAPATPAPAAPTPKTPAEIDAELGLPPAETGLAPLPDQDAGFFEVIGAAWRGETIRTDAWNHAAVRRMELVSEMYWMLSERERQTVGREFVKGMGWHMASRDVVAAVARAAAESPDAAARWARYPQTTEGLEGRIVSDRIADLDEAEAVLGQPGGGVAEFLGSGLRAMTDETSLMLLPFGLSGSLWRKVASEAGLGALGEAAVLPKEYRVAEELDLADPNAAARIGMGAVFGGGFGAGAHLLGRGFSAYKARIDARRASLSETVPDGVDRIDHEAAVDAAEAQLRGDHTVQERLDGGARAEAPPAGTLGEILGRDQNTPGSSVKVDFAMGPNRPDPPNRPVLNVITAAVEDALGPGARVVVVSGQEGFDPKTGLRRTQYGSNRHGTGDAADIAIFDAAGNPVTMLNSPDVMREIARAASRRGAKGIGLGTDYMGGVHMHIDLVEPGPGQANAWGAEGKAMRDELAGLYGTTPLSAASATAAVDNTPGLNYNEDVVLAAIIGVESSGNPTARASTSSAAGLGQILTGTWLELIQKHRPDLMEGRTQTEILALRDDADLNAAMTKAYMRDNHAFLKERGIEAGPAEIYLAHFMGPGGAAKTLKAAPETPISQLMSPKEIKANASVRFNGKSFSSFTAYDLRMWSASKMRRGNPSRAGSDVPNQGTTSRGYTGQGQVAVGDNTRIDVDYEVVDYRSLIRASGDLQPRDRTRINSDEWIASTAARLDPAQLMPAPTADRGTPIVGPDNVIESGNGRSMAIARAYERHPDRAEAYRSAIEAAGYTIPDGVEQPVLIARRKTDLTPDQRRQLVIDAQDSGVAQMTPTEVARATARNLASPILARLDPSQPLGADANGDFVRAALATLPRSARNAMFDPGGALNALGQRQLKEAIFARAWPDPDILARYTEGAPAELKSLMEALETAAPSWAALKADIEAGLVTPDMDISGFVLDAMRLIGAARELGTKGTPMATAIAELLDEVDMLKGAISPLTAALVRKMWRNGRAAPADEVSSFLTRYADEARKAGQAGGMFDAPGPRDVLRTIDPDSFKDLPEDLGQSRGFATRPTSEAPPETVAQIPGGDFDQGARSPEAEATHAEIEASLRGDTTLPAAPAARQAALDDPAASPMAETDSAPVAPSPARAADPIAAARDELAEFADIEIDLPDGTTARASDILDDLDRYRAADAFLQACGITSGGPQ